ncbi:MAG: DNA repair protein RecN [Salinispira sp.]
MNNAMIEELYIENYALIEKLTLRFSPGMNTLTGETGAGKSILAGALSLLLGMTASTSSVRKGAQQAVVTAAFLLPPEGGSAAAGTGISASPNPSPPASESRSWLEANAIEIEDDRVIIRRIVKSSGKGSAYIQGVPVSRQQLLTFTSFLVDMHGQHEHQSLFNIQYHRRFIDAFGNTRELCQKVHREFLYLSEKKEELASLKKDRQTREREAELLRFAIKEINEFDLQLTEDDELNQEQQKLRQYESLFSHIDTAYSELRNSGPALSAVYNSMNAMKAAAAIDPDRRENAERLESLYYELEDISSQLSMYKSGLSFDPDRLRFIDDRLADISRLKKKYGPGIADVREYAEEAVRKLERLTHAEDYTNELLQEIKTAEKTLMEHAVHLSQKRKAAAAILEEKIQRILPALGMPRAVFKVRIAQRFSAQKVPVCSSSGIDRIEFLLSANKGESLKALKDIASGGEISRVMLAIKNILAESDAIPTLVFDEIDAGIGGEVGRALGEHLKKLSKHKQILCITHLATIAAYADTHILVSKSEIGERTITEAQEIHDQDRVSEIARMLSGTADADVSLRHAGKLLEDSSGMNG